MESAVETYIVIIAIVSFFSVTLSFISNYMFKNKKGVMPMTKKFFIDFTICSFEKILETALLA